MAIKYVTVAVAASLVAACSSPASQPAPNPTPPAAPAAAPPAVGPVAPPTTEADMIRSAMSAAPEAVSRDATVMTLEGKVIRQGTNTWTCMPDGPSPGVDPMCVDKNGMDWAMAWMSKKDPPKDKLGFGYMLVGGSDASNTDPFATAPAPGSNWVDTGPHVMVFNIGDKFAGYPTTPGDAKAPFVMFPGTPYAHLMLPVK